MNKTRYDSILSVCVIKIDLGGKPHYYYSFEDKFIELFFFEPHEEGWVVLVWQQEESDSVCIDDYIFYDDFDTALDMFLNLVENNGG